ncbi:MAG TPA: kelch repeat-containing protein [Candidatus Kapabacteria bacterium]|nr:kelch repeat-containing protein [Candidatus Kapabacteria bacterium]
MMNSINIERILEEAIRLDLSRFPAPALVPSLKLRDALAASQPNLSLASANSTNSSSRIWRLTLLTALLVVGATAVYFAPKFLSKTAHLAPAPQVARNLLEPSATRSPNPPPSEQSKLITHKQEQPQWDGRWLTASSKGFDHRYWFTTAAVNGKLYAIGGTDGRMLDTTVQMYDTKTDRWTTLQTTGVFTPRAALTSCVVNGKIYVMGGSKGPEWPQNLTNALEVFDPATNTWTTPKTTGTFTPRCVLSSAVINGKIYVVGGFDCRHDLSTLEVFDPGTSAWTTPVTTGHFDPRGAFQAVVFHKKLYVVDGMKDGTAPTTVQVFDPVHNHWDTVRSSGRAAPRCDHACGEIGGKIYVMGGAADARTPPLTQDAFQVFDPATGEWRVPRTRGTFTSRAYVSSVVANGKLYVLGGLNSTGSVVSTNEVFEPTPRGLTAPND